MILAVALTLSLCIASVPFALAVDSENWIATWAVQFLDNNWELAAKFAQSVSADILLANSEVGEQSPEEFNIVCQLYRNSFYNSLSAFMDDVSRASAAWLGTQNGADFCMVKYDPATDRYRLYNNRYKYFICRSDGQYPWCSKSAYEAWQNSGASLKPSASLLTGKLVDERSITYNNYELVSESCLLSYSNTQNLPFIRRTIKKDGKAIDVYVVGKATSSTLMVYCNSRGYPYVAYVDFGSTAAGNVTTNNYNQVIDKTTNSTTNNQVTNIYNTTTGPDYTGVLMDINNGILNIYDELGNLDTQDIYNVSYDYSDHSYNVTTYSSIYNTTNNHYDYEFNTYNIQYTYNNTYITYIGSTAEYQPKEWELYYELPDGRSSADLTEEDVAGLSFQFADCINYKKSAADTRLRALYHFDGNVNDVSYFSDKTSFTWNSGASITYMESNAFNGALYLDEKEHQFTITLPSNIGSGDFTLQWRYYQNNATTSNHNENYVTVGGQKVLSWSENYLYNGSGTQLAGISIGTWQELALVRNQGTVYVYHNGVKIGSVGLSGVLTNKLVFYFGSNSRGYSMLDELRLVKGALYTAGEAYTPTTVPYDTNQVLVLPDSPTVIPDNYWQIDKAQSPKLSFDFVGKSYTFSQLDPAATYSGYSIYPVSFVDGTSAAKKFYYPTSSCFSVLDGGLKLDCAGSFEAPIVFCDKNSFPPDAHMGVPSSSISYLFYLTYYKQNSSIDYSPLGVSRLDGSRLTGTYVVTALFSDGTSASSLIEIPSAPSLSSGSKYSIPFSCSLESGSNSLEFVVSNLGVSYGRTNSSNNYYYSTVVFAQTISLYGEAEVSYLEIVPGSVANDHKYITAIYDAEELQPNTAAIQTDIPINGYTVGGVRPTFPVRGDVWLPVEGSRISGVQVYNGQAWVETNARWWTGSRWIPIYAFDLVTLADMWDISSSEGSDVEVTPPITSESGFWNWWKKSWTDFTTKLFGVLQPGSGPGGSGSGSGSGSGDGRGFFEKILDTLADAISKLIEVLFDLIAEIFKMLLSVVTDMLSAIFSFVTDTVLGGISSFFSFFTDGSLFEFFESTQTIIDPEGNEVEQVVATLPEGVASVFAVFSGIILLLPWELRSLLIFGIAAAVLISVFKFVKA